MKEVLTFCPTRSKHKYIRGFNLIDKNFFRSRSLSIDSWLAKEENLECVDAAKLLIAHVIGIREQSDFSPSRSGFLHMQYRSKNPKSDWYQLLFNALSTNKFEDFPSSSDKLTVATFNYDRSLEFYFLKAMQGMYRERSEGDCWEKLSLINIKHVYGSVGDLPIANAEHGVEYGSQFIEDYMNRIKNLNLIPEFRNKTNETISFIQGKLKEAQNIFFVGFSYDRMNLELLGFPFQSNQSHVVDFSGSVYKMEDGEIQKAQEITRISTMSGSTAKLNPVDADAYNFFRKIITKTF